jgi:3-methyladenine DNA glycosylase/8-oxoguanine DNA glycosylase
MAHTMLLKIPTPPDFSFERTAFSHGWTGLLPFEVDPKATMIIRVLEIGTGGPPITVSIPGAKRAVNVRGARAVGVRAARSIERDVRHMLRLDDDLTAFYGAMQSDPDFEWIPRAGAGRLVRSPTVFEDLVKSLCTTNCTWALTKVMVGGLVNNLGREAADGRRAFPTPEAMAAMPESFYRDVRAGYRAPYLKELAQRVAAGELDVEGWLTSELPTAELKREMKRVKGVGDYAAENLLKLVGRYDVLALDSWVRATFARTRNKGRAAADAKIARFYSRFDSWRGLALWCDMTKDWLEEKLEEKL